MLPGVKALAFDTGGTVLDWHSGIRAALAEAGARHGVERDWAGMTNTYRSRALRCMTSQVNPGFNIDDVHRTVLDELADEYRLDMVSGAERTAIVRRWHSLDAWPDFPAALERLRRNHIVVSFTILQRLADHRYRAPQWAPLGRGDLVRNAQGVQTAARSVSAGC